METFYINPSKKLYQELDTGRKTMWHMAVLDKHAESWGIEFNKDTFELKRDLVLRQLKMRPTESTLDHLWNMFFATGDIGYLQYCFSFIGNEKVSMDLAAKALEKYERNMSEFGTEDGELVSPWDDMQKLINQEYRDDLDDVELDGDVNDLIAEIMVQDGGDGSKSAAELVEQDEKMAEASVLFNSLLSNVLESEQKSRPTHGKKGRGQRRR